MVHTPPPIWKRLLLPLALGLLAIVALWIDLPLAGYFKTNPWKGDLQKLIVLCEAFGYGGTVAFILIAAALLDPRGCRVLPRLALASYGAGLLADLIKTLVGRHRPLDETRMPASVLETFTTWAGHQHAHLTQSFPSAHTATAAGLACGLSFLYPRGRWLFIALVILTAVQRLHAREHYLSDVLAGAGLGTLIGIWITSSTLGSGWLDRLERSPKTVAS